MREPCKRQGPGERASAGLEQVRSGSAPGEGAMEVLGGWSRGRCRIGQLQSGPTLGEGAMQAPQKNQEARVGAGAGVVHGY